MDFEKLYQTYFMDVYSYCMTILKNPGEAEEVTQDVFYKAMKTSSGYQGRSGELTWLCTIAKNACFDVLRKASRTTSMTEDGLTEVGTELQSVSQVNSITRDIVSELADENTSLQIHKILHSMDEPYKEVFQLRVFGELSFQAIAKIFGKTESWARVTYHRAKIQIQERMN